MSICINRSFVRFLIFVVILVSNAPDALATQNHGALGLKFVVYMMAVYGIGMMLFIGIIILINRFLHPPVAKNGKPLKTHVEFRLDKFSGKKLAFFLHQELSARGIATQVPFEEDWGWVVPLNNKQFSAYIGCGKYSENRNGFLCFIEPHTSQVRRWFKTIDTSEFINSLRDKIQETLASHEGISKIKWWTHEEFNNPHSDKHNG